MCVSFSTFNNRLYKTYGQIQNVDDFVMLYTHHTIIIYLFSVICKELHISNIVACDNKLPSSLDFHTTVPVAAIIYDKSVFCTVATKKNHSMRHCVRIFIQRTDFSSGIIKFCLNFYNFSISLIYENSIIVNTLSFNKITNTLEFCIQLVNN